MGFAKPADSSWSHTVFEQHADAIVGGLFALGAAYLVWAKHIVQRYEEYQYETVDEEQLSGATRRHFETCQAQLAAVGFKRIGTYQLRPWPKRTLVRYLIHQDRTMFATIDDIRLPLTRLRSYGLISVLTDGLYIESSPQYIRDLPAPEDNLVFVTAPGATLEEMYRMHREAVQKLAQERGAEPIVFEPQQFREVSTYGHRLVALTLYRKGYVRRPPAAVLALKDTSACPECVQG